MPQLLAGLLGRLDFVREVANRASDLSRRATGVRNLASDHL